MNPVQNKRILLGVTGSIAAYKAVEIASALTQSGALVDVILSDGGERFVTPLTFRSVTGRPAFTNDSLWTNENHVPHITLGHNTDLICVAPASANVMADIVGGRGDTLLPLTILASNCPLLIAPAMDGHMYQNAATQSNVKTLIERGAIFIGPEVGRFASGMSGLGRFSEPAKVIGAIRFQLSRTGDLAGKTLVISAGGTREPIDPVRFISNRSSGKQGYALAQTALDHGANVILITSAEGLKEPYGANVIRINTAQEMLESVMATIPGADALIMCAAVADYRPLTVAAQKIKKSGAPLTLELEATDDILLRVSESRDRFPKLKAVVGFAAETQDLIANAEKKLTRKKIDFIVANDISRSDRGMGADQNQAEILFADGSSRSVPLMSKAELSDVVIAELVRKLRADPEL